MADDCGGGRGREDGTGGRGASPGASGRPVRQEWVSSFFDQGLDSVLPRGRKVLAKGFVSGVLLRDLRNSSRLVLVEGAGFTDILEKALVMSFVGSSMHAST